MTIAYHTDAWIDNVMNFWQSKGVNLNAGATPEKSLESEKSISFQFPQLFKDFHAKMDGFQDYEWNEHMFSVWSYDRIVTEYKEDNTADWVVICDFLIRSHDFGFKRGDDRVYKNAGNMYEVVASSFQEFVSLLLIDDSSLY